MSLFEQQFRTHPVVTLSWSSRLSKRIWLHSQNTRLHISICAMVFMKPRRRARINPDFNQICNFAPKKTKTCKDVIFYTIEKTHHLFCDLHRMDFPFTCTTLYVFESKACVGANLCINTERIVAVGHHGGRGCC